MKGSCLCGEVAFELGGEIPQHYQCHCSLCRKVSGSSANAAMIVACDQLEWLRGTGSIAEFVSETGFKSHFCKRCGSPLPNITRNGNAWWVPVGLLDDDARLSLGAHLYTASRAQWDRIEKSVRHFDQMPDAPELDAWLSQSDPDR